MWIAIFEAMGEPSDLLKVIKTCKHFYALAVRVLYRNLQWISPIPFVSNARFWRKQTIAMTDVPTSLVVGISHINSNSFARFDPTSAVVEIDGSWNITPPHPGHTAINSMYQQPLYTSSSGNPSDWRRYSFFASKGLYDTLSRMISTFSMLQELVFHHAELPETIYPAIKSLPRLRHLAIQYCSLPVIQSEPDVTFADLPITSLILWCSKADSDQSPTSNYVYALHLCTARNLRVLKVDWTAVTARFFALTTPHVQAVLPTGIEDLTLRMPVSKLWPSEGDASRSMLIVPLVRFLRSSPSIRCLSVFNRLPSLELDAAILPNLNTYIGPLATVVAVIKDRPVEHLEISDVDKKLTDFVNLLPEVARIKPDLKTLCLVMREWDNEILHAIYQLFTDLRKIRIKYEDKYPSEVRVPLLASYLYLIHLSFSTRYSALVLSSSTVFRSWKACNYTSRFSPLQTSSKPKQTRPPQTTLALLMFLETKDPARPTMKT